MSGLPPDPWRSGDAGVDLLVEGGVIIDALAGLEEEPSQLAPAIEALSSNDLRAVAFALTFERWLNDAVRRRRPLRRLVRAVVRRAMGDR